MIRTYILVTTLHYISIPQACTMDDVPVYRVVIRVIRTEPVWV